MKKGIEKEMKFRTAAQRSAVIVVILVASICIGYIVNTLGHRIDIKKHPREYSEFVEKYSAEYGLIFFRDDVGGRRPFRNALNTLFARIFRSVAVFRYAEKFAVGSVQTEAVFARLVLINFELGEF